MKNPTSRVMTLLGLLVMGVTAAYGSTQPKMNGKLIVDTLAPEDVRYTGKPYIKELGAYAFNYRNYDPQTARWTTPEPSGFPDGANNYKYGASPLSGLDTDGLTWKTNWDFFVDWVMETGAPQREYGQGDVELSEMQSSPGAQDMRDAFKNGNNQTITNRSFGTVEAYFKTATIPWSTSFQVGGFLYDATNNGDGTVTYEIRNQASIHSFFLHIPGLPHKPRGGDITFGGNIDQVFRWTEDIPE